MPSGRERAPQSAGIHRIFSKSMKELGQLTSPVVKPDVSSSRKNEADRSGKAGECEVTKHGIGAGTEHEGSSRVDSGCQAKRQVLRPSPTKSARREVQPYQKASSPGGMKPYNRDRPRGVSGQENRSRNNTAPRGRNGNSNSKGYKTSHYVSAESAASVKPFTVNVTEDWSFELMDTVKNEGSRDAGIGEQNLKPESSKASSVEQNAESCQIGSVASEKGRETESEMKQEQDLLDKGKQLHPGKAGTFTEKHQARNSDQVKKVKENKDQCVVGVKSGSEHVAQGAFSEDTVVQNKETEGDSLVVEIDRNLDGNHTEVKKECVKHRELVNAIDHLIVKRKDKTQTSTTPEKVHKGENTCVARDNVRQKDVGADSAATSSEESKLGDERHISDMTAAVNINNNGAKAKSAEETCALPSVETKRTLRKTKLVAMTTDKSWGWNNNAKHGGDSMKATHDTVHRDNQGFTNSAPTTPIKKGSSETAKSVAIDSDKGEYDKDVSVSADDDKKTMTNAQSERNKTSANKHEDTGVSKPTPATTSDNRSSEHRRPTQHEPSRTQHKEPPPPRFRSRDNGWVETERPSNPSRHRATARDRRDSYHRESSNHCESFRGPSQHRESFRGPPHHGESFRGPPHHGESFRGPPHHGESFRGPPHHGESFRGPPHRTHAGASTDSRKPNNSTLVIMNSQYTPTKGSSDKLKSILDDDLLPCKPQSPDRYSEYGASDRHHTNTSSFHGAKAYDDHRDRKNAFTSKPHHREAPAPHKDRGDGENKWACPETEDWLNEILEDEMSAMNQSNQIEHDHDFDEEIGGKDSVSVESSAVSKISNGHSRNQNIEGLPKSSDGSENVNSLIDHDANKMEADLNTVNSDHMKLFTSCDSVKNCENDESKDETSSLCEPYLPPPPPDDADDSFTAIADETNNEVKDESQGVLVTDNDHTYNNFTSSEKTEIKHDNESRYAKVAGSEIDGTDYNAEQGQMKECLKFESEDVVREEVEESGFNFKKMFSHLVKDDMKSGGKSILSLETVTNSELSTAQSSRILDVQPRLCDSLYDKLTDDASSISSGWTESASTNLPSETEVSDVPLDEEIGKHSAGCEIPLGYNTQKSTAEMYSAKLEGKACEDSHIVDGLGKGEANDSSRPGDGNYGEWPRYSGYDGQWYQNANTPPPDYQYYQWWQYQKMQEAWYMYCQQQRYASMYSGDQRSGLNPYMAGPTHMASMKAKLKPGSESEKLQQEHEPVATTKKRVDDIHRGRIERYEEFSTKSDSVGKTENIIDNLDQKVNTQNKLKGKVLQSQYSGYSCKVTQHKDTLISTPSKKKVLDKDAGHAKDAAARRLVDAAPALEGDEPVKQKQYEACSCKPDVVLYMIWRACKCSVGNPPKLHQILTKMPREGSVDLGYQSYESIEHDDSGLQKNLAANSPYCSTPASAFGQDPLEVPAGSSHIEKPHPPPGFRQRLPYTASLDKGLTHSHPSDITAARHSTHGHTIPVHLSIDQSTHNLPVSGLTRHFGQSSEDRNILQTGLKSDLSEESSSIGFEALEQDYSNLPECLSDSASHLAKAMSELEEAGTREVSLGNALSNARSRLVELAGQSDLYKQADSDRAKLVPGVERHYEKLVDENMNVRKVCVGTDNVGYQAGAQQTHDEDSYNTTRVVTEHSDQADNRVAANFERSVGRKITRSVSLNESFDMSVSSARTEAEDYGESSDDNVIFRANSQSPNMFTVGTQDSLGALVDRINRTTCAALAKSAATGEDDREEGEVNTDDSDIPDNELVDPNYRPVTSPTSGARCSFDMIARARAYRPNVPGPGFMPPAFRGYPHPSMFPTPDTRPIPGDVHSGARYPPHGPAPLPPWGWGYGRAMPMPMSPFFHPTNAAAMYSPPMPYGPRYPGNEAKVAKPRGEQPASALDRAKEQMKLVDYGSSDDSSDIESFQFEMLNNQQGRTFGSQDNVADGYDNGVSKPLLKKQKVNVKDIPLPGRDSDEHHENQTASRGGLTFNRTVTKKSTQKTLKSFTATDPCLAVGDQRKAVVNEQHVPTSPMPTKRHTNTENRQKTLAEVVSGSKNNRFDAEINSVSDRGTSGSAASCAFYNSTDLPPLPPFPASTFWNMYPPAHTSALTGKCPEPEYPSNPPPRQPQQTTPNKRQSRFSFSPGVSGSYSPYATDSDRPRSSWKTNFKQFHNFGVKYIDTHCHLDFLFNKEMFKGNLRDYMEEHPETFPDTFEGCVAVFCNPATFKPFGGLWLEVAKEDNVWIAMGCHPKMATDFTEAAEVGLQKCLKHSKCIALGEIGLDYSGTFRQHEVVQKRVFRRQLDMAIQMRKPLVIHCRDAEDDCLEILKEVVPQNYKIHCHCFTNQYANAKLWLEAFPNLYIGVTPLVTFRSATPVHDLARKIPIKRLLLETDAPYFTPKCIPRHEMEFSNPGCAVTVAKEIAQYQEIPVAAVLRQCRLNTKFVYGI